MTPIGGRNPGQSLTEDPARARSVAATKPPYPHTYLDRYPLPGEVLQAATVTAVSGSGHLTAQRAYRLLFGMDDQSESVRLSFDAVQYQDAGVGKKGLRMARGRYHCLQSLKHSQSLLFWSILASKVRMSRKVGPKWQVEKGQRRGYAMARRGGIRTHLDF